MSIILHPNKNKIHKLLTKNGYVKKHSTLVSFVDDWYVYSFDKINNIGNEETL